MKKPFRILHIYRVYPHSKVKVWIHYNSLKILILEQIHMKNPFIKKGMFFYKKFTISHFILINLCYDKRCEN